MDALHQLVEGLRSSMLTAPPTPLPTAAVQTSTPVDSPSSDPHPILPSSVPASTGLTFHTTADMPDDQVPGQSSSTAPALLEGQDSSVTDPHPIDVPTDLLVTLWSPTGDAHSPQLVDSGVDEDYAPPPCPLPTNASSDATMVVDTPAVPPPTIVVTSPDVLLAPGPVGIVDGSVGDGVDTQMDTTT